MEIQFQKQVMPCLKTVCRQYLSQEQTQEVRLPEGMPDIGTVLSAWGQIIIRGKEWHSSSAGVSGGVMAWVIYLPEDGGQIQQIECWMPFQESWDFPSMERDGNLQVIPMLRSVDARTLSARKMMVRASVGLLGRATVPDTVEIFQAGEMPEDVQLLTKVYPMRVPVEAGEKVFHLDENLPLADNAVPVEKILRYALTPELTEMKVVSDKLVIRGIANLAALYLGNDELLHAWNFELPFSQYTQLNQEYEPNASAEVQFGVTSLELEAAENNTLNLKAGLTGQYTLYDTPLIEIVEDAYSPVRPVVQEKGSLQIPMILDSQTETILAEQKIQTDMMRVVDVVFYPENPSVQRQGDDAEAALSGTFHMLGYTPEGELQTATARWSGQYPTAIDSGAGMELSWKPMGKTTGAPGAGDVSLNAQMQLQSNTTMEQGMDMVTGLELGDITQPDPNRPSIILRRPGTDTLWNIAKETDSTVTAIQSINNLQNDPQPDQMLIIPVL